MKLQSHKELEKKAADLFSVRVVMSDDPSQLVLKGAHGEGRRLVLVQSEHVQEGVLPDFLSSGGVADAALAQLDEEENGADEKCSVEGADEAWNAEMDHEADLQEQEHMQMLEASDGSDAEEILSYSSEEEMAKQCATSHFSRVKTFDHREEWRALTARGATNLPPETFLGYHATSRTWQGYFGGKSIGLTKTHGGRTNRTAGEALLSVIQGLVERRCGKFPRDKMWAEQLKKLNKTSLTIAKLWCAHEIPEMRWCIVAGDACCPVFACRPTRCVAMKDIYIYTKRSHI